MERGPADVLEEGTAILATVLEPAGFDRGPLREGRGSGGHFAILRWVRGPQYVETHVRRALGIVIYGWDDDSFSHQDYMRWRGERGAYPGFSDDPIAGFRHLAGDLSGAAGEILSFTRAQFSDVAEGIRTLPCPRLP